MTNSDKKKRGVIFLAIALVCMLLSTVIPASNTLDSQGAVILVSIVRAVVDISLIGFLIAGIYYLITGLTQKA